MNAGWTCHPAAEAFPLLTGAEFEELVDDIRQNGQRVPVTVHGGVLLDGRNRIRACETLGIDVKSDEWDGRGSPADFVISVNLRRRHLTPSQRACLAVELQPVFAKEAKERQREHGKTAPGRRSDTSVKNDGSVPSDGEARSHAARSVQVSTGYVATAATIHAKFPELFAKVKSGEVKLTEARRRVARAEVQTKAAALPAGKFRVIYADPPWKYGNSGMAMDGYGPAEAQYPTMSVAELCALDIKGIAADDAVLFLWVTSPMLEQAFPIIRAWGFTYKTSFVWDKVNHNFGHYNSVRHEFLLIATRGSCTPEATTLLDSVQTIERPGRHSEKPEEFRQIIETLYPSGRRVELFARTKADGWERFSNEI